MIVVVGLLSFFPFFVCFRFKFCFCFVFWFIQRLFDLFVLLSRPSTPTPLPLSLSFAAGFKIFSKSNSNSWFACVGCLGWVFIWRMARLVTKGEVCRWEIILIVILLSVLIQQGSNGPSLGCLSIGFLYCLRFRTNFDQPFLQINLNPFNTTSYHSRFAQLNFVRGFSFFFAKREEKPFWGSRGIHPFLLSLVLFYTSSWTIFTWFSSLIFS